jgi:RNA polymerase-interacting CarD/CdnL/TRCF family regulator
MRYQSDDWIVHPEHGVGRVIEIETKQFGQQPAQAYYKVAITTGTIWVPVEGYSHRLRDTTPKADLDRYRSLLRGKPTPLATNHKERYLDLEERLKEYSFQAICEVVRDLKSYSWNNHLPERTSALLRRTHQFLCAEWATADGLPLGKATYEVNALLLKGKEKYCEQTDNSESV